MKGNREVRSPHYTGGLHLGGGGGEWEASCGRSFSTLLFLLVSTLPLLKPWVTQVGCQRHLPTSQSESIFHPIVFPKLLSSTRSAQTGGTEGWDVPSGETARPGQVSEKSSFLELHVQSAADLGGEGQGGEVVRGAALGGFLPRTCSDKAWCLR